MIEIFLHLLHDVAPLAHVQTVQELTDILVPHTADLLDVGGGLRDILEVVTGQFDLVLLVLGGDDLNTRAHRYAADELLAQEVPTKFINIRLSGQFLSAMSFAQCKPYLISTSCRPFSLFLSRLTLMGK